MEANAVDQMSMWSLISNASLVVQFVMLILVGASIMSWVLIFQRSQLLRTARSSLTVFEDRFWSGVDLSKLYLQVIQTLIQIPVLSRSFARALKSFLA